MSQPEPIEKGQQQNEGTNEIENAAAVAVATDAATEKQTADIFKLDIDCFEETFDYSSLRDLVSIGKTCKRLQRVAEYCFRQYYAHIWIMSERYGGRLMDWDTSKCEFTHFAQSIRCIFVDQLGGLQYLLTIQSKLRRLKKIEIFEVDVSQFEIDRMQGILSKVEYLRFCKCNFNVHEIIANCPNLRQLWIICCVTPDLDWLDRRCSSLEFFAYDTSDESETGSIERVMMFLVQNPNIRTFVTRVEYLWENRELIKNASTIKLDVLAIMFQYFYTDTEFASYCHLLNELYERGFFARLEVEIFQQNEDRPDQLASLNGLVKLSINNYCTIQLVSLSILKSLEEFCAVRSECFAGVDIASVACDLTSLKRLNFAWACFDDLMPFIRRVPALNKIQIGCVIKRTEQGRPIYVIDLVKLNEERAQLPNARKITLYVKEEVYLATKWALKETDFALIRLKRSESFEWNSNFT